MGFSSAFNIIQHHFMMRKLFDMNVNSNLVAWIQSYLTLRPQYAQLNCAISDCMVTITEAPQSAYCLRCYSLYIQMTVLENMKTVPC